MSPVGADSPAMQRLQALVVVALVATGVLVDIRVTFVSLAVMVVVWPPRVGWTPLPIARVLRAYGPFVVVWLAITIGYLQAMHAVGAPVMPQDRLAELARQGLATPELSVSVLEIVVLAPLFEEIVFRGYLFGALRTWLPSVGTQLLVAVLFGLVHGLDYAFPISVLALLFGWLRARYDALLPSILAHAVHNGLTVAITLFWPGSLDLMYPR